MNMNLKELIERIPVFDDTQEVAGTLEPMHDRGTSIDKYSIRESQANLIGMYQLLVDIVEPCPAEFSRLIDDHYWDLLYDHVSTKQCDD